MLGFGKRKSAPSDKNSLLIQSARQLLLPHQQKLRLIQRDVGVPLPHWQIYYQPLLEQYAYFVQQLPASEAHHHAQIGGILLHALDVVAHSLRLRQGKLLPAGADTEELADKQDLWTYAVVSAALLHDVGKPVVDQQIRLFDRKGCGLGQWSPWLGWEAGQAKSYQIRFNPQRRYKLHERIAPLIASHIVPLQGLAWLASDLTVMEIWTAALLGEFEDAGLLGEIVHQADGLSAAADLVGNKAKIKMPGAQQVPLHERLMTGLRYLLYEQKLPLNHDGAAGWVTEDSLWLVVKRALDTLKEHLNNEGQTGIPGRNSRLMDELQQNNQLTVNAQGKAIWKAAVSDQSWPKAHTLTLLRFPLSKIWPDEATRPPCFSGAVTVQEAIDDTGLAETDSPAAAEIPLTDSVINPSAVAMMAEEANKLPLPPILTTELLEVSPDNSEAGPSEEENDLGMQFLNWLREGLRSHTLVVNKAHARIHIVPEGLLLVSPGIFRDFDRERWSTVQKRFQKLKLNQKTPARGENIYHYAVEGPRQKGAHIKGFLIVEVEAVFPGIDLPSANPCLKRVSD